MKKDYTRYLEIIDKYINVDWNFTDVYEKIIDGIIAEHEKEKIQPPEEAASLPKNI